MSTHEKWLIVFVVLLFPVWFTITLGRLAWRMAGYVVDVAEGEGKG